MKLTLPGETFWRHALTLRGSVTSRVLSRTLFFALSGAAVALLHQHLPQVAFDPAPFASLGVVLGLLLVFRSSAGYNRWWEARVLWGSITNESRNLLVSARAYGPRDPAWQRAFAAWIAAFAPASRCSLRRQRTHPALEALLGPDAAAALASAPHMPSHVSEQLAALLHQARAHGLDGFAFDQLDHERARLIEHIGGCERILATPIPHVVEVMTRRFLTMYLLALPFGFVDPMRWFTPLLVAFVAYPILSLEQIGAELQNPFVPTSLSHLPLDALCEALQGEIMATAARPQPLTGTAMARPLDPCDAS